MIIYYSKMNNKQCILETVFGLAILLSLQKVHCSEYTKEALKRNSKVGERRENNGGVSLAFVFDRTGSMFDDLVQVREGASRIFNNTIKNGTLSVQSYILVPFRDPDVGPSFTTADPAKFLKALNDIYVQGGKDCPEMSVTAIKQALELSLPGSIVYVFTDAEAKDHRVLPDVVRLIKQKNIRVNFILTGNCGLEKNFTDKKVYEKVAILSSGQIVNLNKSEVNEIWDFVEISVNPNRKNIYSVDKFTRGKKTYFVKIDPNINQVVITVTGEDVDVIIRDRLGEMVSLKDENVDTLLNLNSVVSVLIRNPPPGNWSVTVRSNGRQTLRVEAISDEWGPSEETDHKKAVIPEVNECTRDVHNCEINQECFDLPYEFTCFNKCSSGLERSAEGLCEDVNECARHKGICRDGTRCVNVRRSYRCEKICPKGYEGRGYKCKDINECSKTPSVCGSQECINMEGTYRCQERCSRGFTRDGNGVCKDVDECLKYPRICGNRDCFNVPRSYRCLEKCSSGFARNKDDDCEDVDECSQNPNICGDRECLNTQGNYTCLKKCSRWYKREGGSCKDVNECVKYPKICGNRECVNTEGGYYCQTKCTTGFTRDQDGYCKDMNECSQNATICGDQDCVNLEGTYRCEEKCLQGFIKDKNGYCIDVDECSENPPKCQHQCENTVGAFQCLCPQGTRLENDGTTCSRVSRCPWRGYGRCQYKCNTETGKCECPSGYRLHWDQTSCIDINECLSGDHECGKRECFNTLGKYHCLNVSCPHGYFPTTDGYCSMQCFYQTNQCPAQHTKLQHTSISIPRYLPVNTDFLQLRPYIPPASGTFEGLSCYCVTYFYPIQNGNHLFGVYQIGQVGVLYNKVVFDEPGFYELQVASDYMNGYGNFVSRTTFRVFVDISDYTF